MRKGVKSYRVASVVGLILSFFCAFGAAFAYMHNNFASINELETYRDTCNESMCEIRKDVRHTRQRVDSIYLLLSKQQEGEK